MDNGQGCIAMFLTPNVIRFMFFIFVYFLVTKKPSHTMSVRVKPTNYIPDVNLFYR